MVERTPACEHGLPLVFEAEGAGGDTLSCEAFRAWVRQNRSALEERLLAAGAILFRGTAMSSPEMFKECVATFAEDLLAYVDGNSPRTKLSSGVYTSTDYPPEFEISLHNELSYSNSWPAKLYFGCLVAPETGGATAIADSRAILATLSPTLVEEFRRRGIKYVRNLHGDVGPGPSWQDTFETADKAAVEDFARQSGCRIEWTDDGALRIIQIGPATVRHPRTGEEVWFNQAEQFHPSTLRRAEYEALMSLYDGNEAALPQYACFADDTPIDVGMLQEVREVMRRLRVTFAWHRGDLMAVDNVLVCHGRMPFTGDRRVLVSMTRY